jgi:endonuclease/exonuclease/phosphatase family metal-dependent hydrolase
MKESMLVSTTTRLPVRERKGIRLCEEWSAVLVQLHVHVDVDNDDAFVWVIGTHLDFANGQQWQKKIKVLLKELEEMGIVVGDDDDDEYDHGDTNNSSCSCSERVVLVGDLNQ